MVLRLGKGTLYHTAACRNSTPFSGDFAVWHVSYAEVLLKMQCGDVSCVKRARVLSRREIREVIMDSNSDEDKYYTSQDSEDKEEPRPPSRQSSISQVQIIPPAALKMRMMLVMWQVNSHNPVGPGHRQVTSFYRHVVGKKISHRDFRLTLIRVMLARAWHKPRPSTPVGRTAQASTNIERLDTRRSKHWPGRNNTKRRCRMCSAGRDANIDVQMCQVWRGALCGLKLFCRLPHTKTTCKTYFRSSSMQTVEASTTM